MKRELPDWIDSYMKLVDNTEPSYLYKKWCAVSAIASALQRKCYLVWDSPTYPNFYVVLVGPSGARKGTAMAPIYEIITRVTDIKFAQDSGSSRALVSSMEESSEQIAGSDNTVSQHCSLTIFSPELAVFLSEGDVLFQRLTDLFDCRPVWRHRTEHMGSNYIENVWLNLIGAITPSLLQDVLVQKAVGGGLASRMIFVHAFGKEKTVPYPFQYFNPDLLEKLVNDLSLIRTLYGQFKVTEEVLKFWGEWYPESEERPPANLVNPNFEGYLQRRPKHLLKLAMIMSASRTNDMVITLDDVKSALTLLTETEKVMHFSLLNVGASEIGIIINSILTELDKKEYLTRSDVITRHYQTSDLDTVKRAISTLIAAQKIELETVGTEVVIKRKESSDGAIHRPTEEDIESSESNEESPQEASNNKDSDI